MAYRTIDDIVNDEFSNELENIKTSREHFAGQVFDGMRLMRVSEKVFEEKQADVEIKNCFGSLPRDFYKEREVSNGNCYDFLEATGNTSICHDEVVTFNIKNLEITSTIKNGIIRVYYYGIQTDKFGMPLIPESHGIDIAIKAYLRFVHTKSRYYTGEVGIERYRVAESYMLDVFRDVRGDAKMPPPAGYRRITRIIKRG